VRLRGRKVKGRGGEGAVFYKEASKRRKAEWWRREWEGENE